MAINKNFVIKNGVQVSTDLIIGDADTNRVGVGTTVPGYDLHIGIGRKSRGGIGATDLVVTGVATVTNVNVTGLSTFAGALDVNGTVDFSKDVVFNGTNDITYDQSESALVFNDGAAIRVGTSSDFSITHDGSNTILRENGTGDLQIYASRIELGGASVDETTAVFTENGAAELWFNNTKRFETVGHGATVFGDFIVSGVTTSASLKVTGISTFNGDVDINANVDVSGNTVLNGNVDLGDATSDTITATGRFDSDLVPSTDGARDLGTTSLEWEDLHLDGTAHIDTLDVDETAFITTKLTVGTGVTVQSHGVVAIAGITTVGGNLLAGGDILPDDDGARDLGSSSKEFQDLFIDGTANIDSLAADTAAIGDLTDNRVVIAGTSGELEDDANFTFDGAMLKVGTAATIAVNGNAAFAGIVTVGGDLNVIGDIVYDEITGRNLNITGITTLAGTSNFNGDVNLGNATGDTITATGRFDSDIVPSTDGARDLGTTDLEFKDLFIDGTANIDALVADTADINGGTVDAANIGASTPGTGAFTTLSATTSATVGTGVTVQSHGGVSIAGITTIGGLLNANSSIDVVGNIDSTVAGGDNDLKVETTSSGDARLKLNAAGAGGHDIEYIRSSNTLNFKQGGGSVRMSIAADGTVDVAGNLDVGAGIDVTGAVNVSTNLDVDGTSNFADDVTLVAAGSSTILFDASAHDLIFQDNIRAKFGTGSDLDIHHNGTDSVITNATGDLNIITTGDDINITAADDINLLVQGSENGVAVKGDGEVILYHNSLARVTTTAQGADFGGTGSIRVPNGTTGERNSSPAAGDFRYNTTTGKFEGYTDEWGDIGGSGGVEETSTSVSSTSATSTGSFAIASFRSASIIAQITQGSNYQVGRYLVIHDGTTVTTIEESAVATGSMLGTFEGVINSSNLEFRVTMGSSSSATVKTKIDTVTV